MAWSFLPREPLGASRSGFSTTRAFSDLDLQNAGEQVCLPRHRYAGIRDQYIIHLVLTGRGRFLMNGTQTLLEKGSLFFIPPGVHVDYQADDQAPWHYTWVGYNGGRKGQGGDGLALLGRALPVLAQGGVAAGTPNPILARAFGEIQYEFREKTPGHELRALGHFHHLLACLPGPKPVSSPKAEHVEEATAFLIRHHTLNIEVGQVCEALGLERTYLSALYRRTTGNTLSRTLEDLRLSRAEKLLTETQLTIAEVARSSGYEDPAVFMKMFRRRMGLAPGQWRDRQSQTEPNVFRGSDPSPYG